MGITLGDRFWSKVERTDGCWLWMAYTRSGYGRFMQTSGGRRVLLSAHRAAYEAARGPIPQGLVLDHLCRTKRCVRPDHLEAVTQAENIRRGDWFIASNALRVECPSGHPYDEVNTYVVPSTGGRACRSCRQAARRGAGERARERRRRGLGPGRPGRPKRTDNNAVEGSPLTAD